MGGMRKFWIGLGLSALLLLLFLGTVHVRRMFEALAAANYAFVAPAIASYLISMAFRTMRWRVLLSHMRPIKVTRLYPVVVIGFMANALLPMRLGEVVRSYYVGEREGISKTAALATTLVEQVMDGLTLLFLIAAIAVFVPVTGLAESLGDRAGVAWPLLAAALTVPFVCGFVLMMLFARFPDKTRAASNVLVRHLPDRIAPRVQELIGLFLAGLKPLRSPQTVAILFLLSVPVWVLKAGVYFFVAFSFGLDKVYQNLGDMAVAQLLVSSISNLGSSIPSSPGGIGLFELVTRETLMLFPSGLGIERSVAGGYAVVVHAVLLLSIIALGQLFLWAEHISIRNLWWAGRAESAERALADATNVANARDNQP